MKSIDYCYQQIAPPGSGLYYSLRALDHKLRGAVVAIHAFYQEIENITLNYDDAHIAHIKLNWWRDEVIKIKDSKPDHPIALSLQENRDHFNPLQLCKIIDGLEQNLTFPIFDKFEDVVIHIIRTAGVREQIIADLLQKKEENSGEIFYQFALIIELVNYLQHLRKYVRRDLFFFSQDELNQFRVTTTDLRKYVTQKNIRELLQTQTEKIDRAYQNIENTLTKSSRSQLKYWLIRCEMAYSILQKIKFSDFNVLEYFINITPLQCWWIAWRG